jgi:hypothetical protein
LKRSDLQLVTRGLDPRVHRKVNFLSWFRWIAGSRRIRGGPAMTNVIALD